MEKTLRRGNSGRIQTFGMIAILGVALAIVGLTSTQAAEAQTTHPSFDPFLGLDGSAPSMEIHTNGVPTVAYFNPSTSTLNIARCADSGCSSVGITSPVTTGGERIWPSLRLNPSGNPVVAYTRNGKVEVLRCNDTRCAAGGDTIQVVANEADLIGFPALALDDAGFPTVAYIAGDTSIRVVRCLARNCSEVAGPTTPVPESRAASVPLMEIGPDGPVLAYTEWNGLDQPTNLVLITCSDQRCANSVDVARRWGDFADPSLELADSGTAAGPLVHLGAALDTGPATRQLRHFTCFVNGCSNDTALRVGSTPNVDPQRRSMLPDMALSDTGPVFAFWDIDLTGDVLINSSATEVASELTGTTRVTSPNSNIDGFHWPDIEIHDGRATIATVDIDGLRITTCSNEGCIQVCNNQPVTVDIAAGGTYAQASDGDVVRGTPGGDTINGGTVICALGGNDNINPGKNSFTFAGAGHDVINLRSGKGFVSAGPGNDSVVGSAGLDRIFGGPGSDTLYGRGGTDRLSGGDGNDTLDGGAGDDNIFGNLGRDTIKGGDGNDTIKGGAWIDNVDGGAGDDDRCGIVEGEVRINCERGVFGVGIVYGTCTSVQKDQGIEVSAQWTSEQQPTGNAVLQRDKQTIESKPFETTATFVDTDVSIGGRYSYVVTYRVDGRVAEIPCGGVTIEADPLDFFAFDVEFDPVRPLVYMTDRPNRALHVVSLNTGGIVQTINFEHLPETLAVTPNGDALYVALPVQDHSSYWFDDQYGFFARIDLGQAQLEPQLFGTTIDPFDIVATDDGVVAISSGSGQWTEIQSYDGQTGEVLGTANLLVREQTYLDLHPSQDIVYGADTGLSPSDIQRWDIAPDGSLSSFGDSPYHGDYEMAGDVWAGELFVITRGGHAFTAARSPGNDMIYVDTLTTAGLVDGVDYDFTNDRAHVLSSSTLITFDLNNFQRVAERPIFVNVDHFDVQGERVWIVSEILGKTEISSLEL